MSNLDKTNHHFNGEDVFVNNIFADPLSFNGKALEIFLYQSHYNKVYKEWCNILNIDAGKINSLAGIPFLPVSFFKSHKIVCGEFNAEAVFESSGTTKTSNSKHFVKDVSIYKKSFLKTFETFYGNIKEWCVIGLLPSYLERQDSSLVLMVDELIKRSGNPASGFYLDEFDKLRTVLKQLESLKQKTLLIGVTFALLDFAETHPIALKHTVVMETGGMKGRRKELTRPELHSILQKNFHVNTIHSEYGMTEILSQAYSKGDGKFICPPWMKVLLRDEEDPLSVKNYGKGILNIIDLANIYSCSFIATDDAGIVYEDGSFEVIGRVDNSDIRGCSLLAV